MLYGECPYGAMPHIILALLLLEEVQSFTDPDIVLPADMEYPVQVPVRFKRRIVPVDAAGYYLLHKIVDVAEGLTFIELHHPGDRAVVKALGPIRINESGFIIVPRVH